MKDYLGCGIICLGLGMVIGGIVVAKNKKLAKGIDDGTDKIVETAEDIKDNMQQKIKKAKQKNKKKSSSD